MKLLIVDAQKLIMTDDLYRYDDFIANVQSLILHARQNQIEVIYVQHDDGYELTKSLPGFEVADEFVPAAYEKIFVKHVNSAFRDTGLLEYLKEMGEKQIIVAGLQTDYCIDATIKCGFEHGLQMIVPEYCNTSIDNEFMTGEQTYRYYNEKMWNKRYATCTSMEEALQMMYNAK